MSDDAIIAALWQRYRGSAEERVELLERWVAGAVPDDEALVAAHKLAGSFGSYGRPEGSRAALELERRLRGDAGSTPETPETPEALVQVLRDALGPAT